MPRLSDCHLNFETITMLQESMKVGKQVSQTVLTFLCHSMNIFVMYFIVSTLMVLRGISKVVVCFVRHIENKQTALHWEENVSNETKRNVLAFEVYETQGITKSP